MPRFIDLTGQRFGRLVVLKLIGKNKWGSYQWLCRCDCGKEKIVRIDSLKSGRTKSCGCLNRERLTKHGHYGDRTYKSWSQMIQRCTNPNNKYFKDYGGRGITVCERWLNSFPNFLEDMGESPKGHQIDRMNNDKGYHKSNCLWVTPKQNSRNRRSNHLETHNGKTQCITAWSEEVGIPEYVIRQRLKHGWSIERALTTPVKKYKRRKS